MSAITPPVIKRRKLYRTRIFLGGIAGFVANSWEYVKRTYQEGKHIRKLSAGIEAMRNAKILVDDP